MKDVKSSQELLVYILRKLGRSRHCEDRGKMAKRKRRTVKIYYRTMALRRRLEDKAQRTVQEAFFRAQGARELPYLRFFQWLHDTEALRFLGCGELLW
jgi:hypothetical protein